MGSDSNDLLSSQYKAVYTHRRCLPVLLKKTGLCQVLFACNHHKIVFHHHYHINNNQHISSIHGILQARILEWVALPSSSRSFQPRDGTTSLMSPALAGRFFIISATGARLDRGKEAQNVGEIIEKSRGAMGLPRCLSSKESIYQCRRHRR